VSIQSVVTEWLEWGVDPDNIVFDIEDEREFCADVMQTDKEWLYGSFTEGLARNPGLAAQLIEDFRIGDFAQIGATVDRICRHHIMTTNSEYWLSEFTQLSEQNSIYQGDE
jgi:hypothetical protein